MSCDSVLSLCVGGLITSIGALAWCLKQQHQINNIEGKLTNGETL